MVMNKTLIYFLFSLSVLSSYAQSELDDYHTEITWGVNKNTNGGLLGGFIFKIAKERAIDKYTVIGLELVNVKHPLEQRYLSPVSGSAFIWGKQNYLYSFRGQYGREYLLYKKAPQQGVQISGVIACGPSIGIIAPYYVLFNGNSEPFDPSRHTNFSSIQGSGRLFEGLSESSLTAGMNVKAGLSFEFGSFKNSVVGIELGVSAEVFPKKIILVPTQENNALFTALYMNMYWGTRR